MVLLIQHGVQHTLSNTSFVEPIICSLLWILCICTVVMKQAVYRCHYAVYLLEIRSTHDVELFCNILDALKLRASCNLTNAHDTNS